MTPFDHLPKQSWAALLIIVQVSLLCTSSQAQSDPSNFATVINVPPEPAPDSIDSSTQLNLDSQGVIGSSFRAGNPDGSSTNVEVNISGGTVGDQFVATGSVVNVRGGQLGSFSANEGSVFNISGGVFNDGFSNASAGSEINISGGLLDTSLRAFEGSLINVSGGQLTGGNHGLRAGDGSEFNISGGTLGSPFNGERMSKVILSGGTVGADFDVRGDTQIFGGEFQLNGVDFFDASVTLIDDGVLTGTLQDGSPFVFSPLRKDRLEQVKLTTVPLPAKRSVPLIIDRSNSFRPAGLREGETLIVRRRGSIDDNFAVVGGTLNVEGGAVGSGVEVVGGTVNLSSGRIDSLYAFMNAQVNIEGGSIPFSMQAFQGSNVDVSGGSLSRTEAKSGSTFDISGGRLVEGLQADEGSVVAIQGGKIGIGVGIALRAQEGSTVEVSGGQFGINVLASAGTTTLVGGEFKLNGANYDPTTVTLTEGDLFTGTLTDGSPFIFTAGNSTFVDVALSRVALPAVETTPITIERGSTDPPVGLRPGQKAMVTNRGRLGENFNVVQAAITLDDGSIADGFQAYESLVNINGGTVGNVFNAYAGTVVNVTGGTIGRTAAEAGSEFNISGGRFENGLSARPGSTVNVAGGIFEGGGEFSSSIGASTGSVWNISGGSFDDDFSAASGSTINLIGSEFFLNGILIEGLRPGEMRVITERSNFSGFGVLALSGVLEDGSPFSFVLNARSSSQEPFFSSRATLTVTLSAVPEPSTLVLTSLSLLTCLMRRQR